MKSSIFTQAFFSWLFVLLPWSMQANTISTSNAEFLRTYGTTATTTYLTAPENGAVGVPVNTAGIYAFFIPGATLYTFELNTDASFNPATAMVMTSSSRYLALSPGTLKDATTYYARVKTNLADEWGSTSNFTTTAPYLTLPENGAADVPLTTDGLYSIQIPGATLYTFELNTDASFNPATATVLTSSSRYLALSPGTLKDATTYYVRIKTNISENWGPSRSFTTTSPYLTSPANGAMDVPLNTTGLYANFIPGATLYTFELNTDASFNPATATVLTSSSRYLALSPGTLKDATTYYVRIKTNISGNWSPTRSFSTTAPYLTSPANGSVDVPLNITGLYANFIPGATSYTFELNPDASFNPATATVLTSSSRYLALSPGTLKDATTYYVRVRTGLSSNWGPTVQFATTGPYLTSPANGATGVPLYVNLYASFIPGATSYTFELNPDASFNPATAIIRTSNSRYVAIGGGVLQYGTTYFVRVRTNLSSNPGVTRSFTTVTAPAGRLAYEEVESPRLQVSPNPFSDQVSIRVESEQDESLELMLTDLQGRVHYVSQAHFTNQDIRIGAQLQNGMYLLRTQHNGKVQFSKLLKTR